MAVKPAPMYNESTFFLQNMFPGGVCHLSVIMEGRAPITQTFKSDDPAILEWVEKHNKAGANVYFAVNPLKNGVKDKKAKREDVKSATFVHVDVDDLSESTFETILGLSPPPSAIIMSGGGYQLFWKYDKALKDLGRAEDINKAAAEQCGGDHCHNADRIMRIPGTINWPNEKKRKAGRVPVLAQLLSDYTDFDRTYDPAEFSHWVSAIQNVISAPSTELDIDAANIKPERITDLNIAENDRVVRLIVHGLSKSASKAVKARFTSRSELIFAVINRLLELRILPEHIAGLLINPDYAISERVLEQSDPIAYCIREIEAAMSKFADRWPDVTSTGRRLTTLPNALKAMEKLGVHCEFDAFHNRKRIEDHQLQEFSGDITDDGAAFLRDIIIRKFNFDVGKANLADAIAICCIKNRFHPVLDYLDGLKWDGVPRVETLFIDHFGAEDTPLNRAAARIMLTAAVRRVREPGCKYDIMIVLEGPQGTGKSTALLILAGEENFSDQSLFTLRDKEQMEAFEGVWIYEVAELDGMSGAEVSRIKALITRRYDRARPAFARFKESWPRQSIMVGTTNEAYYLKDDTGNRRFLPVVTDRIDLRGLARDRDQLWAEATHMEAHGEPIYLKGELIELAKQAAKDRQNIDPWEDILTNVQGFVSNGVERISTVSLFGENYLNIPNAQLKSYHPKQLAKNMKALGWNGPKQMRIGGKKIRGYERPTDKPDDEPY